MCLKKKCPHCGKRVFLNTECQAFKAEYQRTGLMRVKIDPATGVIALFGVECPHCGYILGGDEF